ncbi:hypothetical protein Aduo_020003 [Ancylostoma duodenale]
MDAQALQKILEQNAQQMQLMQQMMQALLSGEMKPQQAVAPTEDGSMLQSMVRSPPGDPDGRWCVTR